MLKYVAALAVVVGMAVGSSHCGFAGSHRHGSVAAAPQPAAV
jgi:hypothetical protein